MYLSKLECALVSVTSTLVQYMMESRKGLHSGGLQAYLQILDQGWSHSSLLQYGLYEILLLIKVS